MPPVFQTVRFSLRGLFLLPVHIVLIAKKFCFCDLNVSAELATHHSPRLRRASAVRNYFNKGYESEVAAGV